VNDDLPGADFEEGDHVFFKLEEVAEGHDAQAPNHLALRE